MKKLILAAVLIMGLCIVSFAEASTGSTTKVYKKRILSVTGSSKAFEIIIPPKKPQTVKDYALSECQNRVGAKVAGMYSCANMMATINNESGRRPFVVSVTNDHGLFQLHYKYHKDFINSKNFLDPFKQVDYGISVWLDAKKKGRMPRHAHPYVKGKTKPYKFK